MSYSASYNGRKYGSILAIRSPGRKPSRSPASTAGRVKMMRCTCLLCSDCTAIATASQLLPVPAGPRPKVITLLRMASMYRFWPAVFGRTARPLAPRMMSSVRTVLGRSS